MKARSSVAVRILRGLQQVLEGIVALTVAVLVLDVLWGVCSRFVFQAPSRWTEEVATFLMIWIAMLGSAVAFHRREHLGLDVLTARLDPTVHRMMVLLAHGLVIAFALIVLVYGGYILVAETFRSGQLSPALEVRMGCVYLAVPISGLLIVLFGFQHVLEILMRPEVDRHLPVENLLKVSGGASSGSGEGGSK